MEGLIRLVVVDVSVSQHRFITLTVYCWLCGDRRVVQTETGLTSTFWPCRVQLNCVLDTTFVLFYGVICKMFIRNVEKLRNITRRFSETFFLSTDFTSILTKAHIIATQRVVISWKGDNRPWLYVCRGSVDSEISLSGQTWPDHKVECQLYSRYSWWWTNWNLHVHVHLALFLLLTSNLYIKGEYPCKMKRF